MEAVKVPLLCSERLFQSSTETLSYDETENIFLTKAQKGKGYIEVTFNPDKDGTATDKKIHS